MTERWSMISEKLQNFIEIKVMSWNLSVSLVTSSSTDTKTAHSTSKADKSLCAD